MNLKRLWDTEGKKIVFAEWPSGHECQVWTDETWDHLYIYDMAQWLTYNGETPAWKEYVRSNWVELEDQTVWFYDTNVPTELFNWDEGDEVSYVFKDWDGTVLKTGKIEEWETPTAPADPTRAATAQYTYTFAGWNPTVWPISKRTVYTATYTATVNQYTVTIQSNNTDYGTVDESSVTVDYGTAISVSGNVLTIGSNTITATAWSGYSFSSWGILPATVTENLTITATFVLTYSSFEAHGIRQALSEQLEDVDVMMMDWQKKYISADHYDYLAWWEGFSMWWTYWSWEVFVAVQTNANQDILWIAVKTEEELWTETYMQLRDAFEWSMTDEVWAMVQWWFSTTLTVTTSGWETTISDGGQSIIINITTHAMRYGADYYDWTSNTSTEYATIETNWWLVDWTYTYQWVNQDWNTIIDSLKAKWIVNATITHDTVNGEITMANGQWSMTIMDKNLGATEYLWQTPNNDALAYGDYYCWGWKTPFVTLPTNPNEEDWQQVQTITPAGYHIPTINELRALVNMFTAVRPNAHSGDDFKDTFKMPFAGQRGSWDAVVHGQGNNGIYWSSTPYNDEAYYLLLDSLNIFTQSHTYRSFGDPVRCFKDSAN